MKMSFLVSQAHLKSSITSFMTAEKSGPRWPIMSWFMAERTRVGIGVGPGIMRLYLISFLAMSVAPPVDFDVFFAFAEFIFVLPLVGVAQGFADMHGEIMVGDLGLDAAVNLFDLADLVQGVFLLGQAAFVLDQIDQLLFVVKEKSAGKLQSAALLDLFGFLKIFVMSFYFHGFTSLYIGRRGGRGSSRTSSALSSSGRAATVPLFSALA